MNFGTCEAFGGGAEHFWEKAVPQCAVLVNHCKNGAKPIISDPGCECHCRLLKTPGEQCNDNNECSTGECDCSACHPLPSGYACSTDDNCLSHHCKGLITVGCNGVCE